ncbi:hypothetical protein [Actinocorallia sp. A-T 12471]|nr:hypothetical protein [Actinocorallia sp. A-T 12471]MDX6742217.1 hypothetical protein [Actinocorallia sp. A-T 12471]
MSDEARFSRLPDRVRPEDMVASQAVQEHAELTPDQVELDRQWAGRWYG